MKADQKAIARLLVKAQRGDSRSLQLLCQELESIIRDYFKARFRDPSVVDDLSQETYLQLLKNFSSIKEPMKLRNYVLKVAFHVTQTFFREKYRSTEEEFTEAPDRASLQQNPSLSHDSHARQVIDKMDMEKALEKLPEKTRQILIMKAEGYNYEEIAANMELSVSGVKMQVKRGMEKLKNSIFHVTFWWLFATYYMNGKL